MKEYNFACKSRLERFLRIRKFKKEHPNARVIRKYSIVYGGFGTPLYRKYTVRMQWDEP